MKVKVKVIEEYSEAYKISCAKQEILIKKIYIDKNSNVQLLEQLAYLSLKYVKNFDYLDILDNFDYEEELETLLLSSHECVLNLRSEEVVI